jgi:ribonuclease M5
MISIKEAIIVEGKYDKNRIAQLVDAVILTTDGFGIFNDAEKRNVIKRLAEKRGVIILTDSDGAGFLIRNKLKGMLPPEGVKHAYIPDIYGKERRKTTASKEGMLGVEGMPRKILEKCLRDADVTILDAGDGIPDIPRATETVVSAPVFHLTKADLFELGLSGREDSSQKREKLLISLNLPRHLSVNALLPVINALYTREEILEKLYAL